MQNMDIVYPLRCRLFGSCDELRYSLRSLENIPHRRVHIFGDKPIWTRNIIYHDITQVHSRWRNVNRLLEAACHAEDVTDDFILMNDDFFILRPIKDLPAYQHGTLMDRFNEIAQEYEKVSAYQCGLKEASEALSSAHRATNNFELHVPIILNKQKLLPILKQYPESCARRSLYCNTYGITGTERPDVKIYDPNITDYPEDFVSSDNQSFSGPLRDSIEKRFINKSKYEA